MINPWTNSRILNVLSVILIHVSVLSFCLFIFRSLSKSLKFFHVLASKSPLNLLTKLNTLILKILLRTVVISILYHVLLVILVILVNQEYDWKLGCMSIVLKLQMKRFTVHPLLLTVVYNHYFDFTKVCIMPSPISTSHLNFHEDFYTLINSNNLVNDFSSIPSISDAWKLLI